MPIKKTFFETVDENLIFDEVIGDAVASASSLAKTASTASDVAKLADQLLLLSRPQREDVSALVDVSRTVIVHGDSLLAETVDVVDTLYGGQPVHAAFHIERRLSQMLASLSDARIIIVFFDNLAQSWAAHPRLLALRHAILTHLQLQKKRLQPRIFVERYSTINTFADEHLGGSLPLVFVPARSAPNVPVTELASRVRLSEIEEHSRVLAAVSLSRNHSVLFWETIELEGTHCYGSMARPVRIAMHIPPLTSDHLSLYASQSEAALARDWLQQHSASLPLTFVARKADPSAETMASQIASGVAASILKHLPDRRAEFLPLCKLYVLHVALLHFVDSRARAQKVAAPSALLVEFIDALSLHFVSAQRHFAARPNPQPLPTNVVDWLDGRVLHAVASIAARNSATTLLAANGVLKTLVMRMWRDVAAMAPEAVSEADAANFEPIWPAATPAGLALALEQLRTGAPAAPAGTDALYDSLRSVDAQIAFDCDLPGMDEDDFDDDEEDEADAADTLGDDDELSRVASGGTGNDDDDGGDYEDDIADDDEDSSRGSGGRGGALSLKEQRLKAIDAAFQRNVATTLLGQLEAETIVARGHIATFAAKTSPPVTAAMLVAEFQTTYEQWRNRSGNSPTVNNVKNATIALALFTAVRRLVSVLKSGTDKSEVTMTQRQLLMVNVHNVGFADMVTSLSTLWSMPAPMEEPRASTVVRPSIQEIQLRFLGHKLPREKHAHDERVPFAPDPWQRALLDIVDRNESAVVCAPSSAGKTFISAYCLRRVLYEDNEGVAVFVAPIQALVNQVFAEVNARYNKSYPSGGAMRHAVGAYTDQLEINVFNSQVLVCSPSALEELLLSPSKKVMDWVSRIRYFIFDEVHCINSPEGNVWERLLLLCRAPFLALSATIGSPKLLEEWLRQVHADVSRVSFIDAQYRYNDLNKHVYLPMPEVKAKVEEDQVIPEAEDEEKADVPADAAVATPAAATPAAAAAAAAPAAAPAETLHSLHSLALFSWEELDALALSGVPTSQYLPPDLFLPPDEAYTLHRALVRVLGKEDRDLAALEPTTYFTDIVTRDTFIAYQKELLAFFCRLVQSRRCAQVGQVIQRLGGKVVAATEEVEKAWGREGLTLVDNEYLEKGIPGLLRTLKAQDKLPVIAFSFSAGRCDRLLRATVESLLREEEIARSKPEWKRSLHELEAREEAHAKRVEAFMKKQKQGLNQEQAEMLAPSEGRTSAGLQFKMLLDHSFLNPDNRVDDSLKKYIEGRIKRLARTGLHHSFVTGLERGIGVHHRQMPSQYRRIVEMLFRMRQLNVIFATGTLSLGINMPCRSVVFCGDGLYIDSVNYRQMGGRAGRRGQDDVGHVVFFGLPHSKVRALLTTPLSSFKEARPLQSDSFYRVVHQSIVAERTLDPDDPSVKRVHDGVVNLVTKSMNVFTNAKAAAPQKYLARYLLDFYRRQGAMSSGLLGSRDAARLVSLGEAQFAFLHLFRSGHLNAILKAPKTVEGVPNLLLVCARLFARKAVDPAIERFATENKITTFAALPPLDDATAAVLQQVDRSALAVFGSMGRELIDAVTEEDEDEDEDTETEVPDPNALPLTQLSLPLFDDDFDKKEMAGTPVFVQLFRNKYDIATRSPYAASSGKTDLFASAADLVNSAALDLGIDATLIPTFEANARIDGFALTLYTYRSLYSLTKGHGMTEMDAFDTTNDLQEALVDTRKLLLALGTPADDKIIKEFTIIINDVFQARKLIFKLKDYDHPEERLKTKGR